MFAFVGSTESNNNCTVEVRSILTFILEEKLFFRNPTAFSTQRGSQLCFYQDFDGIVDYYCF